jgi:hypothetical protein
MVPPGSFPHLLMKSLWRLSVGVSQRCGGHTHAMSRLQLLRSYLAPRGRLPWWWMVGNGLVFLLAILLGGAVGEDHRGLDFKSLAVGVVVILVGHAILAVAVVLADPRRGQHDEDAPRPRRDR